MRKNIDKLLSRTIMTYGIVLLFIFVLKMFGLNYFGLDVENEVINKINNFIMYWRLENLWYFITLYINTYIILSISCNDNSNKMKKFTLLTMLINVFIEILKKQFNGNIIFLITDLLYLFILSICYIKFVKKEKVKKHNISNYFLFTLVSIGIQAISMVTRNLPIDISLNFIISTLLSFDYIILCILIHKLYFIKGGKSLWVMVHGSYLVLQTSLKSLPTKLQTSYHQAKPKTTRDVLADRIYLILFWLYNIFSIVFILLIATLNDTFIECIFILTSFWINKGAFGKPFHLRKASTCFIVSTLSYYVLNRVTWSIGLSFLIPITLGIALSYITSLIMTKYEVTRLYRGMPENDFYYLINKVTDNKAHIDICKKFYVDRYTDVKISHEVHYCVSNIKKIKQQINKKIKELQ